MDCYDIKYYWPTSTIEAIHWFPFLTIMEHIFHKIKNTITLLMLLLEVFAMFNMRLWDDNESLKKNVVNIIGTRCRNCGKT